MVPLLKRRKRRRIGMADISLTPLIDTALTLLIIFMVATPMLHNAVRITLPRGSANETGSVKQELVVEIDKSGHFFLSGVAMKSSEVIAQLSKLVGTKSDQIVFVKADTQAQYGAVMEFVDQVKMVNGVKHVALATQKRR
jgi:biopolymer transport protein TolR